MKRLLVLGLLFFSPFHLCAQTIALTFDDGFDPRVQPRAAEWNRAILATLNEAGVKAMLFPSGRSVDSPEGMALVAAWSGAGHGIGNHTYSHRNLGSAKVDAASFIADIERAHALLASLPTYRTRLRFPFLKEGDTAEKRDAVQAWMSAHGYAAAPVSVDTSDWYYNERFLKWIAAKSSADPAPFREAYLAHIWDRTSYYDELGRKILDRRPAHVLLLHTNAINAAFLPAIIAMFKSKGWAVTSPGEAFADPLFSKRTSALPAGESIIWAVANELGFEGLRYPAEDGSYEKARLDRLGL